MTRLWAGQTWLKCQQEQVRFISLLLHPDQLWNPPSLLSIGVPGVFSAVAKAAGA